MHVNEVDSLLAHPTPHTLHPMTPCKSLAAAGLLLLLAATAATAAPSDLAEVEVDAMTGEALVSSSVSSATEEKIAAMLAEAEALEAEADRVVGVYEAAAEAGEEIIEWRPEPEPKHILRPGVSASESERAALVAFFRETRGHKVGEERLKRRGVALAVCVAERYVVVFGF